MTVPSAHLKPTQYFKDTRDTPTHIYGDGTLTPPPALTRFVSAPHLEAGLAVREVAGVGLDLDDAGVRRPLIDVLKE